MSKRVTAILIAVLCTFVVSAMPGMDAQAGASSLQTAGMRDTLRQGIDRAFNMDYPGADALFRKAVAMDPEDPMGYAFQALNHLFGSEVSLAIRTTCSSSQSRLLRGKSIVSRLAPRWLKIFIFP